MLVDGRNARRGIALVPAALDVGTYEEVEADTSATGQALATVVLAQSWLGVVERNVSMIVELIVPIAMEERLRFAIREGGRTVGSGVVASIVK